MPSPGSSILESEGLQEVSLNMTRHFPSFIIYKVAWTAREEKQSPLLSKVVRYILKKRLTALGFQKSHSSALSARPPRSGGQGAGSQVHFKLHSHHSQLAGQQGGDSPTTQWPLCLHLEEQRPGAITNGSCPIRGLFERVIIFSGAMCS